MAYALGIAGTEGVTVGKYEYTKSEVVSLKSDPELNEKWLQDLIARDPSILGLGEVDLIDRDREEEPVLTAHRTGDGPVLRILRP